MEECILFQKSLKTCINLWQYCSIYLVWDYFFFFLAKICWFWICLGYLTSQATLLQPGEKRVLCHLKCLILLSIYFIQFWKCICICFKS